MWILTLISIVLPSPSGSLFKCPGWDQSHQGDRRGCPRCRREGLGGWLPERAQHAGGRAGTVLHRTHTCGFMTPTPFVSVVVVCSVARTEETLGGNGGGAGSLLLGCC